MGVQVGLLSVRRCAYIAAPPERVWEEFTTFERFQRWFGIGHELLQYEPKLGANVQLRIFDEGIERRFGGRIVVFEPGHELTFEDDWIPARWIQPSYITVRLTALGSGTVVELFHHGFERMGEQAWEEHLGYEGGWTTRQVEALKRVLAA